MMAMKRIIFTLLLSAFFGTMAMAQAPNVIIKKAKVTPVLDGAVDDVWATASKQNIDKPFQKETPTLGESGQTTWQALWNDDGIFILLQVTDDEFYPSYMNNNDADWKYDKPEIYFDVNAEKKDGLGSGSGHGHYQFAPGFAEATIDGTLIDYGDNGMHAFKVTAPNYKAEYFIPFAKLLDKDGADFNITAPIGFDVTIVDGDSSAPGIRQRAVWSNIGGLDESWYNMDDCGLIMFDSAPSSHVTSITLNGGSITTDNGTLQMVAKIEPADALQSVKWVVENETGKATIDSKGILTGIRNGTVSVKAIARDGTNVEGKTTVNIIGQFETLRELSYVSNGFFDIGSSIAPWTHGTVVNGVLVCDPTPNEDPMARNYWDWTTSQVVAVAQEDKNECFTLSFKMWSDSPSTDASNEVDVDFEDFNNGYDRYGISNHPYATQGGTSDWNWKITSKPTTYAFDVIFSNMAENCYQSLQFMLGRNDGPIYIDSVMLIKSEIFENDAVYYGACWLSANRIANVNKIKLSPNPVQTELTISNIAVINSKVSVYNALGQKLMEKTANGTLAKFDVAKLYKGMYFVRFSDGTSVKFIKQ
jgi:hypothetical protein